jgi:hypothetical protein
MINQFCRWALAGSAALPLLILSGCQKTQETRIDFSMGERVPVGQMTYSVVESTWKTQLGESFKVRTPEQRFLLINVSATNGTGKDVSIPLLTLEGANGQTYREIADGQGVDNWFGLLRTIRDTSCSMCRSRLTNCGFRTLTIRGLTGTQGSRSLCTWIRICPSNRPSLPAI